jgi:tRNA pseudouridine65 synthase
MELEILFEDETIVAINKPHGLLVHRTKLANDVKEFALQTLRDQLGMHVFPCHRIDRKTSGVLLFTKDEASNRTIQMMFSDGKIQKKYLAIVRGFALESGRIDYELKREDGQMQQAITNYTTLDKIELDLPYSGHPSSRYSLVEAIPETGRMHQIRKHLAHIHHPIIGDRPHGCNKQNKLFKEKWNMTSMMFHARSIELEHPITKKVIKIEANLSDEFVRTMNFLGFDENTIK